MGEVSHSRAVMRLGATSEMNSAVMRVGTVVKSRGSHRIRAQCVFDICKIEMEYSLLMG